MNELLKQLFDWLTIKNLFYVGVVEIILAGFLFFVFTGCQTIDKKYEQKNESSRFMEIESRNTISVFYDRETGVEYARFGSSTPFVLINPDGTPCVMEGYDG